MFIIVPPIESELSCSTGTFLNNYGIRDRKPTFFITCSTVRKRAKRTWDTTVETTKILGKSPKTTKIPLWGNGCHFKIYRVLSASLRRDSPYHQFRQKRILFHFICKTTTWLSSKLRRVSYPVSLFENISVFVHY